MEDLVNNESGYQQVTETLFQTFGQILSEDVIAAIVENCRGDLNESANAIMIMTDDIGTQDSEKTQESSHNTYNDSIDEEQQPSCSNDNFNQSRQNNKILSYAGISAKPAKRFPNTNSRSPSRNVTGSRSTPEKSFNKMDQYINTLQIKNIISQHNKGYRLLIIMRGLPGSGKSYLAKKIVKLTIGSKPSDYTRHILSTDDYFMRGRSYNFDKHQLSEAHEWNKKRATDSMSAGLSPVIIDNTNVIEKELEPYVTRGVNFGYLIEVVEANTPWARNVRQLVQKNSHGVPEHTIKRMHENYENGINGNTIIKNYKLLYPPNMLPPVLRNIPAIQRASRWDAQTVSEGLKKKNFSEETKKININNDNTIPSTSKIENNDKVLSNDNKYYHNREIERKDSFIESELDTDPEAVLKRPLIKQYSEVEKQLEEFAKVESEWEHGESWNDDSQTTLVKSTEDHADYAEESKPQRKLKNQGLKSHFSKAKEYKTDYSNFELTQTSGLITKIKSNDAVSNEACASHITNSSALGNSKSETESKGLLSNENYLAKCDDWSKISMFMSSWENDSKPDNSKPTIVVEKHDSSTCVENGDTDTHDTSKPYKLLPATARDINLFYVPAIKEKIPETRMLDKSSMTNEQIITETFRCKYNDKHFITFRKMFKNIAKADLKDIFDRCCGDPNWAVSIVLEDMANKQISVLDTQDSSASDDETTELCECLAAYDIIPDISSAPSRTTTNSSSTDEITSESTPIKQRKSKKCVSVSETSVKLKRQLEANVVIPDDHYSDYFLKVRKLRRGVRNKEKTENAGNDAKTVEDGPIASTSKVDIKAGSSSSEISETNAEREVGDELNQDDDADNVNFELGNEFVTHLDEYFGRQGFVYPAGIEPKINIPISLLEEINALWLESFSEQLDQVTKQTELMIKQDEEFARQLAKKTEVMAQAGKKPEVPDLKEIMDMEFALSLYQKDVEAEWRNKEPKDLAAKLTRDKLCNLFPDASRDVLSQILMANDNNFHKTLEAVFFSTGLGDRFETKEDMDKFVMKKELERQVQIIAEQKKALSEFEWPLLPKHEKVEMSVVEEYRKAADMHIKTRTMVYQKAQEYVNRGMTQVAYYYSQVADLYTRKFEYANCLAAAYLMQVHASNCKDDSYLDLHFLRVAEALECLDLFLDSHIQRLREASTSRNIRDRSLYFVTGRGIHSAHGKPRLKPATKKKLAERGIAFKEVNPGLLTAKVNASHPLSNEVA